MKQTNNTERLRQWNIPAVTLIELLVVIALGPCALGTAADFGKPNILYLLCDDLGIGDVHCYNLEHGKIATPNMDRLASQGMRFEDAHGGSSVCTPTRYGILTGRYCWRSRLQEGVLRGIFPPLIPAERLTVGKLLQQQGYQTACIGKWHLGYTYERTDGRRARPVSKEEMPLGTRVIEGPNTRGFNYYLGFTHTDGMKNLAENDHVIATVEPIDLLPRLTAGTLQFLERSAAGAKAGTPFFLYFAISSPHVPIVPAKVWQGKSGLGPYGDFVMQTDACIGEVLAALERHGLAENTLVFLASDNGFCPEAGLETLQKQGHEPSAQYRGYKFGIWDGGHRIPFLVRWPGKVKPGSTSDQLVCLTDLMATCADLFGVKLPENVAEDSVSILPVLLGKDTDSLREALVHHSSPGFFAIRQGQWKLALCSGSGSLKQQRAKDSSEAQLYDMKRDPGETKNLKSDHPEVVQHLTKLLETCVTRGRSTPGVPQTNDVEVDFYKPASPN